MLKRAIFIILISFLAAFPGLAQKMPSTDIAIQDIFKACSVALTDFQRYTAERNPGKTGLESYLADTKNYRITTYSKDGNFIVEFAPELYEGVQLRGGGASYTIDAKSMRVLTFTPTR